MKKTSLSLVFAGLLALPTLSLSMGLGSVRTYSNLNERLRAEIPVLSVTKKQRLSVALASNAAFAKRGIVRGGELNSLRFSLIKKGERYYVKVTSIKKITTPYLNFVLELKGDEGQTYREYAIFLDPTAPGAKKKKSGVAKKSTRHSKRDRKRETEKVIRRQSSQSRKSKSRYTIVNRKAGTYGPVQNGETLSGIALKVKPSKDISIQQMIYLLEEANPRQLKYGLQAGTTLNVPEIKGYSATDKPTTVAEQPKQEKQRETSVKKDKPTTIGQVKINGAEVEPVKVEQDKPVADKVVARVVSTLDDTVKPETKPAEVKPAEVKPAETKPAEVKPVEVKPVEVKPVEVKPAETKPKAEKTRIVSTIEQEKPKAKPQPAQVEEETDLSQWALLGGGVAAILGLVTLLFVRRRKSADKEAIVLLDDETELDDLVNDENEEIAADVIASVDDSADEILVQTTEQVTDVPETLDDMSESIDEELVEVSSVVEKEKQIEQDTEALLTSIDEGEVENVTDVDDDPFDNDLFNFDDEEPAIDHSLVDIQADLNEEVIADDEKVESEPEETVELDDGLSFDLNENLEELHNETSAESVEVEQVEDDELRLDFDLTADEPTDEAVDEALTELKDDELTADTDDGLTFNVNDDVVAEMAEDTTEAVTSDEPMNVENMLDFNVEEMPEPEVMTETSADEAISADEHSIEFGVDTTVYDQTDVETEMATSLENEAVMSSDVVTKKKSKAFKVDKMDAGHIDFSSFASLAPSLQKPMEEVEKPSEDVVVEQEVLLEVPTESPRATETPAVTEISAEADSVTIDLEQPKEVEIATVATDTASDTKVEKTFVGITDTVASAKTQVPGVVYSADNSTIENKNIEFDMKLAMAETFISVANFSRAKELLESILQDCSVEQAEKAKELLKSLN